MSTPRKRTSQTGETKAPRPSPPIRPDLQDKTITRERVRQIEKLALRKLRHRLTLMGIRPEDLIDLTPRRHSDD